MQLEDFDYELPPELIAQAPAPERTASRLLHLNGETGRCADRQFRDLPGELAAGDVVVFNDTRVIKARLAGRKRSGGRIEALIERIIGIDEAWAQLRASHAPHEGSELVLADAIDVRVMERRGDLFRLRFPPGSNVFELLERYGSVPLPP
ncbi:MAG TPA: S-adenosylmethionine:tRNA ribosyltransferase-isomerase, partial [Burkholderiales bacterium]